MPVSDPLKVNCPIFSPNDFVRNLVEVPAATELEAVSSDDLGEVVEHLIGIVVIEVVTGDANVEVVEIDRGNADIFEGP